MDLNSLSDEELIRLAQSKGVSIDYDAMSDDELLAAAQSKGINTKSFLSEVAQGATNELTGMQTLAGKLVNPIKTGYDIGRNAAQVYSENQSVIDPQRGVKEVLRQGVVEPAKAMGKAAIDTIIHPVRSFKEAPISTVATVLPIAKAATVSGAKATGAIAKKATSVALGPSTEAISARMANPEAIKNASSFSEIADRVPQTLDKLQKRISFADKNAWGTLSKSPQLEKGAVLKATVADIIDTAIKKVGNLGGPVGRSDEMAINALNKLKKNIEDLPGNTLPETRVKPLIQKLDQNINWTDPAAGQTNDSLTFVRHNLDNMLKENNPAYRKAMVPVDEMMNLLIESEKIFVPKKMPGKGYGITNTTISKLENLHKGSPKDVSKRVLQKLKDITGDDYLTETQNAARANEFRRATTHGSRRTNLGAVVGGGAGYATGSPIAGGIMGGLAGYIADVEGGRIAGNLVDAASRVNRGVVPVVNKAGRSIVFDPRNILLGQIVDTERGKIRVVGFDKNGNMIAQPVYGTERRNR